MSIPAFATLLVAGAAAIAWASMTLYAFGSSYAVLAVLVIGIFTIWRLS